MENTFSKHYDIKNYIYYAVHSKYVKYILKVLCMTHRDTSTVLVDSVLAIYVHASISPVKIEKLREHKTQMELQKGTTQ